MHIPNVFYACGLAVSITLLAGCSNYVTKEFGGTTTINLPAGQKLINAFPEDDDIWYLTRVMKSTDTAETYLLEEKSNLGVMQGTFIIKESK